MTLRDRIYYLTWYTSLDGQALTEEFNQESRMLSFIMEVLQNSPHATFSCILGERLKLIPVQTVASYRVGKYE